MHLLLMVLICLMLLLLMISKGMQTKKLMNREKSSPFECGFDPQHSMRNSFSMRFFMITILFLIFDVEASIILPLPMIMNTMKMTNLMTYHSMIFTMLIMGLFLEWSQKTLDWSWFYI